MAATLLWDDNAVSGQKPQENTLEDLLVFGYACKLFRDDERAKYIDEGRHLIPWMGDERLMIDRYDGRGHLYDLTKHDADLVKGQPVEMSEEEKAVEAACDEERYLELVTDVQEKAMYEEEEWKRYYESLQEGYNAVGFSYGPPAAADAEQNQGEEPEEDEAFVPPDELLIPDSIQVPQTIKEHARIEKTAIFIAKHGIQMEIMIKTRQAKNAQFEFMNFENPLNLYYQHLVKIIKEGKYRPKQHTDLKKEDDQLDQHYLHPSLSTSNAITPLPPPPPIKPIVLPKVSIHDTPYGQLVSSLKKYSKSVKKEEDGNIAAPPLPPFMAQPDYGSSTPLDTLPSSAAEHSTQHPKVKEERLEPPPPGTEAMGPLPRPLSLTDLQGCENRSSPQPQIVPPPPDVQPIIDRMAMYVAKNGVEFELVVKSKRDQRFAFLEPGHVHYQYYDFKKNMFLKEAELKKRLEAKQAERERQKKEEEAAAQANRSISFSIKGRNKEPESVNALKRPLFDYDSSEGEGEEGGKEREKESKSRSSSPDTNMVASAVPMATLPASMTTVAANEVRPAVSEDIEKKQAEERVKDKIAVAARDKLAASTKEKQLQAERKKKAAMFINLLRIVKESPMTGEKSKGDGDTDEKCSQSVTPANSKPASPVPVVFEYNNRSGTPTRLNEDLHKRRKTSRSKSPSESRKKRRKKSPTPPSAYANPHRSPPRFSPARRRSRSPRRGIAGTRRMSPIRPFRSRRSPSPRGRDRSPIKQNRSPSRKKTSSKRSRSRSQSPSSLKHKKKHKRSRSKTPKKKKKEKVRSRSKDRESSKSGRTRDRSADKHKDRDRKKEKEKRKDREKKDKERRDRDSRHKSKHADKHCSKTDKDRQSKERGASKSSRESSSTSHDLKPRQHSPEASNSKTDSESKILSPIPEIIDSSSSGSSSSSEDEDAKSGGASQPRKSPQSDSHELPAGLPHCNDGSNTEDSKPQNNCTDADLPSS